MGPTVGVEFHSKMLKLSDGKKIKAQIWDTGIILDYISRAGTV